MGIFGRNCGCLRERVVAETMREVDGREEEGEGGGWEEVWLIFVVSSRHNTYIYIYCYMLDSPRWLRKIACVDDETEKRVTSEIVPGIGSKF